MKLINWLLFLAAGLLWLVGCGTMLEPVFEPEPNTAIEQTQTEVVSQLPTVAPTALLPTNTAVPPEATATVTMTPTPTVTPEPPHNTATPEPTPRPWATPDPTLPPLTGEIFMVWDPSPAHMLSIYADGDAVSPSYQYFRLTFEPNPTFDALEFDIEPSLVYPQRRGRLLSPDQRKMALLLVTDTNGSGKIEPTGTGYETDDQVLYLYDLETRMITPLVTSVETGISTIAWLPDSQGFLYTQLDKVIWHQLQNTSEEVVLQLPDTYLIPTALSPNGQTLVLSDSSKRAMLYDLTTQQIVDVLDDVWVRSADWSADSEWVLLRSISLYNTVTQQFIPSVAHPEDHVSLPAWSPDDQWLAFTRNKTTLSLWNRETLATTDVLTATYVSAPLWSDDQQLVMGTVTDSGGQLMALDLASGEQQIWPLDHGYEIEEMRLLSWSPDGNWLAFMTM